MKKYIFITPNIGDMGGAQMYLYYKYKTLQEQGWEVSIVHASRKKSILPIFKDFNDTIPEIHYSTHIYTHNKVEKVLDKIISKYVCSEYDKIIIESTCISQCSWGEALAQKIGAKHICYLLQESNTISKGYVDFFWFKQKRGELAGISEPAIEQMFAPFHPLKRGEAKILTALGCGNTVEDVDCQIVGDINNIQVDYRIASIGRINKPFVIPMLTALKDYIKSKNDKTFCVIMLGDSTDTKDIKLIQDLFKGLDNCTLLISGYLFPLPRKLFSLIDVFISSAGSAGVSSREGAITISYDANDFMPIGVMRHTTNNSLFRSANEPPLELKTLLDEILVEHKYTRKEPVSYKQLDYTSHFDFISNSEQKTEYFDISEIKSLSLKSKLMSMYIRLFGPESYTKLYESKSRIKYYIGKWLK